MTESRGSSARGNTLIEVVISVLLCAIMVAAVFSVALTAKGEGHMTEQHNIASQAVRQLSGQLKAYVTGYYSYTNGFNSSMSEIQGPSGSWTWASVTLPGQPGPVGDSCSGCYALSVGTHKLSNYLPASLNGTITYTVAPVNSNSGPQVSIVVNWQNP
jgi:type II secretory pathway pseudopilin PulG